MCLGCQGSVVDTLWSQRRVVAYSGVRRHFAARKPEKLICFGDLILQCPLAEHEVLHYLPPPHYPSPPLWESIAGYGEPGAGVLVKGQTRL